MKSLYPKSRTITLVLSLVLIMVVCGINSYAMKISIVTTTGYTITMDAKPEETISDVKDFVFNVSQIQKGNQRMYSGSTELENSRTLASYNITEGDTLHVKRAAGVSKTEDSESGGFLKIIIILVVLIIVVIVAKKLLFGGAPTDEEETVGGE